MNNAVNWIYHYVSNNAKCDICGEKENKLPDYVCDAHTHGMNKYSHLEFQVVIDYGPEEVGRLLNTMGIKVRDGERFKSGDRIKGLYQDCDVELREIPDTCGTPILRIVIPDKKNRWPEESGYPHNMQMLATQALYTFKKTE